jgi:hypothetical protein
MAKSTYFFGQSVFGQLIDLIDPTVISQALRRTKADRYYKRFQTWDHLVSMLFGVLAHCTSLREICGAMMGLKGKLEHFGLQRVPHRSTLSDANKKRTSEVFELIYYGLVNRYRTVLSDSRFSLVEGKKLVVIDSTTISLFKDILKCLGRKPSSGKSKGGIKVHAEMVLEEQLPRLIWYGPSASNDVTSVQKKDFCKENIYIFDRGYIDYSFYERLNNSQVGFVTRLKDYATYLPQEEFDIDDDAPDALLKDERIELPIYEKKRVIRTISLRRIVWWDDKNQRRFTFLTNLFTLKAEQIALIYKQRWQIELLFKQLKQNFPLKYFLGDNENAISIQIWCALIANLLLTVIKKQLSRKTAFSCIASYVRVNLINYIHLIRFLNNPEKDWTTEIINHKQQSLFFTG